LYIEIGKTYETLTLSREEDRRTACKSKEDNK
jgi:hypothetical protein